MVWQFRKPDPAHICTGLVWVWFARLECYKPQRMYTKAAHWCARPVLKRHHGACHSKIIKVVTTLELNKKCACTRCCLSTLGTRLLFSTFPFYVVAVIGFNQTAYTFGEGDGTVEVCAAFSAPKGRSQIAPNVVVELMGSTSPSMYSGYCVHVYSLQ